MDIGIDFALRELKPGISVVDIKNSVSFGSDIVFEVVEGAWIGEVGVRRQSLLTQCVSESSSVECSCGDAHLR